MHKLFHEIFKGGLVSESFSHWFKSVSPKKCQNTVLSTIHLTKSAQESDLTPYFGDSSQSEKLSEIKTPLYDVWNTVLSLIIRDAKT